MKRRQRKLRTCANVRLLCVDEVGYLSFDDKSTDLLYEVINRRYERKPVTLTTDRPFKEWNEVFPNDACIVTLLGRSSATRRRGQNRIEGAGYRVRESEQETAARRRKNERRFRSGHLRCHGSHALRRTPRHSAARQAFPIMARPPTS
jgi:hypothetical protein